MKDLLGFVLINLPIFFLAIALIWSLSLWVLGRGSFGEICTRRLLLMSGGLGGIWGFFFRILFPLQAAESFDWPLSLYDTRLGIADLAFGITGILAFRKDYSYCLSISILAFCFFPGLFLDYALDVFYYKNISLEKINFLAPFDLVLPLLLAISLYSWHRSLKHPV